MESCQFLLDVSSHCADAGASGSATGHDGQQFAGLRSIRPGDPLAGLHCGAGVDASGQQDR